MVFSCTPFRNRRELLNTFSDVLTTLPKRLRKSRLCLGINRLLYLLFLIFLFLINFGYSLILLCRCWRRTWASCWTRRSNSTWPPSSSSDSRIPPPHRPAVPRPQLPAPECTCLAFSPLSSALYLQCCLSFVRILIALVRGPKTNGGSHLLDYTTLWHLLCFWHLIPSMSPMWIRNLQ